MQSETEISPAKSRTSGSSSLRNAAWRRFLLRLEQTWVCCFLLVIAGIIVRLPALQGQPVWDDPFLIRDNPFIKSPVLILESFRHSLLPDSFSPHYRPLQTISYCFDYLIWNADAFGFHLSNLLLHVGSGVLLYFLLLRLLAPWAEGRRLMAQALIPLVSHWLASSPSSPVNSCRSVRMRVSASASAWTRK